MKQIIINREHLQTRAAFVEDGKMVEYYFETGGKEQIVGSIYKGKITNLEPSLQAAFIDLGLEKNSFLHYWDMIPAATEVLEGGSRKDIDHEYDQFINKNQGGEPQFSSSFIQSISKKIKCFLGTEKPEENIKKRKHSGGSGKGRSQGGGKSQKQIKFDADDIPKKFSVNSNVVVQVTKGPIGNKGPRVTTNLSIPGRYAVLLPNSNHKGVSRRISDRAERARIREMLKKISLPKDIGIICRTASIGLDEKSLKSDISIILEKWKKSQQIMRSKEAPCCIYKEPDLLEKTIRDSLTDGVDEIIVDSKDAYDDILSYMKQLNKKDQSRIKLYDNPTSVFQYYKLTNQFQQIHKRNILLPSGAELCIDETEALIAIDINSRKSRKGKDHPETILNTNLEAAEEIGRQLRLRNIGGLVIIDFIDMRSKKDRMAVYQKMREVLDKDSAKTKALQISRFGLLEMTRQREYESLQDATFKTCDYCKGKGLIKSSITISVELQRQLQEILRRNKGKTPVKVTVHPSVLARLKKEDGQILKSMEEKFGGDLVFRSDPNLHEEDFNFVNPLTGKSL